MIFNVRKKVHTFNFVYCHRLINVEDVVQMLIPKSNHLILTICLLFNDLNRTVIFVITSYRNLLITSLRTYNRNIECHCGKQILQLFKYQISAFSNELTQILATIIHQLWWKLWKISTLEKVKPDVKIIQHLFVSTFKILCCLVKLLWREIVTFWHFP